LAAEFPRGPGLYFNLFSLGAVFLVYLTWISLCSWVDSDSRRFDLDRHRWNALLLSGGVGGLLLFWFVPWFPLSYPLLLAGVAVPLGLYVRKRNALVADSLKVATGQHCKRVLKRWTNIDLGVTPEAKSGPEVHFLPRPGERPGHERPRVRRAQRLPGYVAVVGLLCDGVQRRATEMQLEPAREKVNVRLQIDGVYHEARSLPRQHVDALLPVLRTLADIDLHAKMFPQEGLFVLEIDGGRVDFQIKIEDVAERERVTLQVHDHTQRILRLNQLGMPERVADTVRAALAHRRGLFVICGPDDSGRTTTAYGCLHELDRMRRGIMTIETPIHQRLARFEQVQINPDAGQTPAEVLRRIVPGTGRHVIFVSDVADSDTADMACLKAEEGRLVIVTVRAGDAVAGIFRLVELGVTPGRLSDVLIGVMSQRLVRTLCSDCKVRYVPDPAAVRRANLMVERIRHFYRIPEEQELKRDDHGQLAICPTCRGIGYRGRTGIFEVLQVPERMRELLRQNAPMSAIKQEAVKSGMNYVQDEALDLVIRGVTSIPEMLQVLRE
jgi:general secretion pathway protein E